MRRRDERGSILIETVVAIPALVFATVVIVQGLVFASGLGAVDVAAKDAARAAADSCSAVSPWDAAQRALPDFAVLRAVETPSSGDDVLARVHAGMRFRVGSLSLAEFEVVRDAEMPRMASCR
ncbi:MAG: hypothetical protein VB080_05975 [Propionicimonas sp.]|uniref:hypothetical protein n=1 Tax=Propionicimonas sp. TaxID=1955623 RepID=UPI002B2064D1|nr:hypothetical protein [Propionicimonas sp.]MEA4943973.1 hypothetical protein [Propionicimonas sp.]MEA5118545.1 hypothetical protein [Propionicimonas sp.]